MKSDTVIDTIEVAALTIGMHIHLDGGWLSHPFPRSSFKISSLDQIATLRSLGLKRVRWSPQDSDFTHGTGRLEMASPTPATEPEAEPQAPSAESLRRAALAAQHASLAACERQFAEAASTTKQIFDDVRTQPVDARRNAQALTRQLVDEMIGSQELCIRLLSEAAGDKVSAHALNVSVISLLMGRNFNLSVA